MFLKEPELNLAQISNNGNLSQDQFNSTSWENTEVHTLSVAVNEHYENFLDVRGNLPNDSQENDNRNATSLINHNDAIFIERRNLENIVNDNSFVEYSETIYNNSNFAKISNIPIRRNDKNSVKPDNRGVDENLENFSDTFSVKISKEHCYDSNDDILFHYEDTDGSCSSSDVSPQDENEKMFEVSDSEDSYIQENESHPLPRGIHNPNYPGFQHLAYTLQDYSGSPHSYENSLFSNVYICCKDEEEILQLTLSNNVNQSDETNNNNYLHSPHCCDESRYEALKKSENVENSDFLLENKEIFNKNNRNSTIDDNLSSPSEDSFKDNCISDSKALLNESEYDYKKEYNQPEISEFHAEVVALKQEIYESIEKPLATTIDNISEVVNTVIKHIVAYQQKFDVDVWNTLTCQESVHASTDGSFDIDDNIIENNFQEFSFGENNGISNSTSTNISIDMDDAYITNVKEDLFNSPIENRFLETSLKDEESLIESNLVDQSEICKPDVQVDKLNMIENNLNEMKRRKNCPDKMKINNEKDKNNVSTNSYYENKKHKTPDDFRTRVSKASSGKKSYKSDLHSQNDHSMSGAAEGFDVYNIETAMPLIDLDAIESHLRAAREEERRRRNDREEIRRRLAMGTEMDDYSTFAQRPSRKPSLQARLQSGMNLQICFMNETVSDTDSPLETECIDKERTYNNATHSIDNKCAELLNMSTETTKTLMKSDQSNINNNKIPGVTRPSTLALNDTARPAMMTHLSTQAAFFECQARLQTEARMALAQAKEMAHMQMEIERKKQECSPITEMLRTSLLKAGVQLTGDRRRVSRQMLTDMNVAQLQVIVNELHTQIEFLNESLVRLLIARDELHMGQDSMLVDIEDLTRYLSAKEISNKFSINDNEISPSSTIEKQNLKSHLSSLTSLLTK